MATTRKRGSGQFAPPSIGLIAATDTAGARSFRAIAVGRHHSPFVTARTIGSGLSWVDPWRTQTVLPPLRPPFRLLMGEEVDPWRTHTVLPPLRSPFGWLMGEVGSGKSALRKSMDLRIVGRAGQV